jgi:hypothetical protein
LDALIRVSIKPNSCLAKTEIIINQARFQDRIDLIMDKLQFGKEKILEYYNYEITSIINIG